MSASPVTAPAARHTEFAQTPIEEVLGALRVDAAVGLTQAEAEARLRQYGYNEVAEHRESTLRAFLKKFSGLSAWMLELIVLLSWVLHKYSDLAIVSGLLVVNALVSMLHERRAAGAVDMLRRRLHVNARVRRDSAWRLVRARDLVPGDIVRLRSGDVVPADVKVITGALSADQSALTGESLDVEKQPGDLLYSGSVARRGEATGVVILTGARTLFGRTTELVQFARPKLHIEAVIARVVRWLFAIVGTLVGTVLVVLILRGSPLLEILPLLLVLLLSAVPVALPVMFSVSTAVGAMELARKGVLVTRLSAAEDAATMDVLCVDKTGTITMNRLTVAGVLPWSRFAEIDVLLYGALASQEANQDPIDVAFLAAARERRVFDHAPVMKPLSFTPFEPDTRRTEAVVEVEGQRVHVIKGAVTTVAQACGLDAAAGAELEARAREHAARGFRVLAVARGAEHASLDLVGLVTLHDPPRPDAATLITALSDLGVAVKMLTGDALPVAREVARTVGLANIRRPDDLKASATDAARLLREAGGFAEVYPEDKYTIVSRLQATGHVVGMTGDGVNDAPALRMAEVGIAVSNATDVAKGAASVVLTDEGLSGIVDLVQHGRVIYQRILTWIVNKVSRTILKSAFVAIVFLATGKFVVSALGMMLLVFLTDFAKIALATDHVRGSKQPETWKIAGLIEVAVALGAVMVVEALGLVALAWQVFGLALGDERIFTLSFQTLLYFALFSVVSIRERRRFWASMPSRTLLAALALDALVGTLVSSVGIPGLAPLPWKVTVAVFVYAMLCSLGVNDLVKVALLRWRGAASI